MDRLMMFLTNNASIQNYCFPQMRPEKKTQIELEADEKLLLLFASQ
jgi:hypothetical protein